MKKLLNISVIAALAILPLAANADPMTAVTINTPQDAQTVATTGYVKGAYNALVAGKQDKLTADQLSAISDVATLKTTVGDSNSGLVKAVADNASNISTLQGTVGDASSGLVKDVADNAAAITELQTTAADYATKTGVVNTVKAATGSVTGVSLTVGGTPTGNVSSSLSNATMSGTVDMPTSGTVNTLTTWGDDNSRSTASVTLATESTAISGTVTGTVNSSFTGTGIESGTATGSITGIDIDVTGGTNGYHAN